MRTGERINDPKRRCFRLFASVSVAECETLAADDQQELAGRRPG
jgi:hypothetical protein